MLGKHQTVYLPVKPVSDLAPLMLGKLAKQFTVKPVSDSPTDAWQACQASVKPVSDLAPLMLGKLAKQLTPNCQAWCLPSISGARSLTGLTVNCLVLAKHQWG